MSQTIEGNTYVLKLLDELMTPYTAMLNKQRANLLKSCSDLHSAAVRWGSRFYMRDTGILLESRLVPSKVLAALAPVPLSVHAEFSTVMTKQEALERDIAVIHQLLTVVIDPCTSEEDLRNALPEVLVPAPLKEKYPRTLPAAYTLDGEPNKKRLYDKYYKKICFYASFKLLG